MRRMIFNLVLLLLVVVLVGSLGVPGATASTSRVISPGVSQVTGHSIIQRDTAPSTLHGGTLFEAWPWFGTNAGAATAPAAGANAQSSGLRSTS
jgi:hypothetical protein